MKKQQDKDNTEQLTQLKYSEMSREFQKKLDEAEKASEGKGQDGDHSREWEREVERDQNVRIIADTQMRITREIQ